jgi:hypothetical protein
MRTRNADFASRCISPIRPEWVDFAYMQLVDACTVYKTVAPEADFFCLGVSCSSNKEKVWRVCAL